MKTHRPHHRFPRRLGRWLSVLLVGFLLATELPAQVEPDKQPVSADVFVKDTLELLKVGLGDEEIIQHWQKRGWPKETRDNDLAQLRAAGGGLKLLARVRALMPSGTEFSRLAEIFQDQEIKLEKGLLRFLRPRGYTLEKLGKSDRRLAFHEHEHELGGWFRRTTFFVFVYDAGEWRGHNEAALSRIAVDAMRRRLKMGGLEVGELSEDRLIHKRTDHEFPLFSVMARDEESHLSGMVAASSRVLEKSKTVVVMGFAARMDAANPVIPQSKERLSEMLDSIIFAK